MKKLVMILMLGATMVSCNNTPTKVENPKQVTTLELQQLASIDTTTYKVVEKDDTVYILSTKDITVVKEINTQSGALKSFVLLLGILLLVGWILLVIFA